jgi:plasmid maintenance system killer protein
MISMKEGMKDLGVLPGNRFEAVAGDRKGQYSIRIHSNGQVTRLDLLKLSLSITTRSSI